MILSHILTQRRERYTLLLNTHLNFAACGCGSTLLFSVEVFWKQCSDEGAVRGHRRGDQQLGQTQTGPVSSSPQYKQSALDRKIMSSFPGSQKQKCS